MAESNGHQASRRRGISGIVERVDGIQQGRRWLAFPFAVAKKFGDDEAGSLAALIAYYGFFSLFPLLLVLVTLLGFALRDNPDLQQRILDSALAQFPVIGDQIASPEALAGSTVALVIGIATALWAGMGVMQAAQRAMNEVWDVPKRERPGFLESRLRSLLMLAILGTVTLASTGLAAVGAAVGRFSIPLGILTLLGSLVLNLVLFLVTFRVLTDRDLSWGDVFPGAVVAAVLWWLLQALGTTIVGNQIGKASNTYGTFALVIGLLAWIYLGAQMTLLSAEINVVRKDRLWPRSLLAKPPLTAGDEGVLTRAAKSEERIPDERVDVSFEQGAAPSSGGTSPAADAPTAVRGDRRCAGNGTEGAPPG
jgi:membrane protein